MYACCIHTLRLQDHPLLGCPLNPPATTILWKYVLTSVRPSEVRRYLDGCQNSTWLRSSILLCRKAYRVPPLGPLDRRGPLLGAGQDAFEDFPRLSRSWTSTPPEMNNPDAHGPSYGGVGGLKPLGFEGPRAVWSVWEVLIASWEPFGDLWYILFKGTCVETVT